MKSLVEYLQQHGIIFKSLEPLSPKALGTRKRASFYIGIDLKGYYVFVVHLSKKSRVLRKEAQDLDALHAKAEKVVDSTIKHKILVLDAPLCSKAKMWLREKGWRVFLVKSEE